MKLLQINYKTASLLILATILLITAACWAVTSKTTTHSTAAVFLKGETENTVIGSRGTISLAAQSEDVDLGDLLEHAWIVNAIVKDSKGNIYIGTSPNGDIIKYSDGKAQKIYPLDSDKSEEKDSEKPAEDTESAPAEPNEAEETSKKDAEVEPFLNLHVFALAIDSKGRLLAGISGEECKLIRFEKDKPETIFTSEDVNYILEIITDKSGNIYLGTGPNGQVYRLDPKGKHSTLVYDSQDDNILALAVDENNFIYAGSDNRGLVYKIHPFDKSAVVLYDTPQDEVTDIVIDDEGNVYATATSAKSVGNQTRSAGISAGTEPGRPDTEEPSESKKISTTKLKTANTVKSDSNENQSPPEQAPRGSRPKSASHIYKIDPRGFVSNVFFDNAVFFNMLMKDGEIILGTGNKAELVSINTLTEQNKVVFEDQQASQITALAFSDTDILIGTSNPAKLVILTDKYIPEGTFVSELVDAGQPARWGKLQVDAELPKGTRILLAARSGNVDEPNDPTFSDWSKDVPVTDATQLECPIGRYCQYRLTMSTKDASSTPTVNEVVIPHVVDNLPPKIMSVNTSRSKDPQSPESINISFMAIDLNKDKLRYKVEFRKTNNTRWILLKEKLTSPKYEWKTNTVEDGTYEVRVTVDDSRSNTTATTLTGSRISDQITVDNTPPVVESAKVKVKGKTATLKIALKDELSVIGNLSYTVNSSQDWVSTIPDDLIYDTTTETFTITVKDLEPGENVIAIRFSDTIKNTKYKSYEANVK